MEMRLRSYVKPGLRFDSEESRRFHACAAWWLFRLSVRVFKKRAPDFRSISVSEQSSIARTSLGWCKYDIKNRTSVVNISAYSVLDSPEVLDKAHLWSTVINIACHEMAHHFVNLRYIERNKLAVQPHGQEWKDAMYQNFKIFPELCTTTPNAFGMPNILDSEEIYWSEGFEEFLNWCSGKKYDQSFADRVLA